MNSDDKKLTPGKFNKIMDAWLNNKPLEVDGPAPKPYDVQDYCSHQYEPYTGLFHTVFLCRHCNKKKEDEPKQLNLFEDFDDNGSFG